MTDVDQMAKEELRIEIAKALGLLKPNPQNLSEAKSLGWRNVTNDTWSQGGGCITLYSDQPNPVIIAPPLSWVTIHDCPNWPTSIADAWELVEEVGLNHWTVTIENIPDRPAEVLARIFIPYGEGFYGSGDNAPLAICRAWLKWKQADNHGQD